MLSTFKIGGVHPPENKLTAQSPIETMPLPEKVTIPVSQSIGAPAEAVVAKGDTVKVGQLIAKAGGFVSANTHSSVSGTVLLVDNVPDLLGTPRISITIKVEGDQWNESIDRTPELVEKCDLDPKQIIEKIGACGIVGMGGATFPTQVKLSVPPGKKAQYLIINGVECEPYLTADHRLMLEKSRELLVGVSILSRALDVEKAFIGIENNKKDAIGLLKKESEKYPAIEIVPLKVKYPQGGEKQLIAAITGREVPSCGLPIDVGVVVQNVGTAYAVYEAVQKNKPLFERVVTVTGKCLAQPKNLLVRIGTPLSTLLDYCGGIPENTGKIISGGPMMGRSVTNTASPVTKGTSGVLAVRWDESRRVESSWCIRCGKCIEACPMGLEPYLISKESKFGLYDELEANRIQDCIECGCCQFTCPAGLPLLDFVRMGKAGVMRRMRERAAKK